MKKLFLILILTFTAAGAFCQYRGRTWGEDSLIIFQEGKLSVTVPGMSDFLIAKESARMMDQVTEVFYIYSANKLKAIGYKINWSKETEDKLLKNLNSGTYQTEEIIIGDSVLAAVPVEHKAKAKEEINKELNTRFLAPYMYQDILMYQAGSGQSMLEAYKQQEAAEYKNAKIVRAQYLYTTDVWAYINTVDDYIAIIYTEKQTDF